MNCVGVVQFDYPRWAVRYPEFAKSISEELAEIYFEEAGLYCDNTPTSPVCDLKMRQQFLWMLTSHIAALNATVNGEAASPLVGRISSATEGSVSVTASMDVPPGSAQWFAQTKYGLQFWQASAQFRTAFYVPPPDPYIPDPYEPLIAPFNY